MLLAAWGVLLVTRGRVRRAFAVLTRSWPSPWWSPWWSAYVTLPDGAGSSYDELMGRGAADAGFTGWFWTAAVCSVLSLVPAVLAVRLVPRWPEMGSRYDAPGPGTARDHGRSQQDLWQELDEGRDPTDTGRRRTGQSRHNREGQP